MTIWDFNPRGSRAARRALVLAPVVLAIVGCKGESAGEATDGGTAGTEAGAGADVDASQAVPSPDAGVDASDAPDAARPVRMLQDEEKSGTRLRLRLARTNDGLTRRVGIYDTVLETACTADASFTAGGKPACLPPFALTGGDDTFADEGCTVKAASVRCNGRFGATQRRSDACAIETSWFRRSGPPTTLYTSGPSGCSERTANVPWVPVEDISADVLAAFAVEVEPLAGGLSARWLRSADGAKLMDALLDAEGEPCSIARGVDGALRCLPVPGVVRAGEFRDAECTQPAYTAIGSCKRRALVQETAECPPKLRAHAATRLEVSYLMEQGVCTARPTSALGPGAEIPIDTFVKAESSRVARASGRLEETLYRIGDAALNGPIRDVQLDVECAPREASDGTTRCLPVLYSPMERRFRPTVSTYFADVRCTTKLAHVTTDACGDERFALETVSKPDTCATGTRVYAITGRHEGPVYIGSAALCTPFDRGQLRDTTLYDVREIPAEDFAEVPLAEAIRDDAR